MSSFVRVARQWLPTKAEVASFFNGCDFPALWYGLPVVVILIIAAVRFA
jgi:hypothetical protein